MTTSIDLSMPLGRAGRHPTRPLAPFPVGVPPLGARAAVAPAPALLLTRLDHLRAVYADTQAALQQAERRLDARAVGHLRRKLTRVTTDILRERL
jgi:hypothetical protein